MQNLGTEIAVRVAEGGEAETKFAKFVFKLTVGPFQILFPETYSFIAGWLNYTPGLKKFGLSVDVPPPKSRKEIEQEENSVR